MDFAVIKTGGKQYKVKVGDILKIEKLSCFLPPTRSENRVKEGDILKVERISSNNKRLEFGDLLAGKKVTASIIGEGRRPKVRILKFHAKKRSKKVTGHRQKFDQIKIEKIT